MQKHPCFSVIPAILALALITLSALAGWQVRRAVSVFGPAARTNVTLLIDPGHGGEDGGAVSAAGVPESGINLAIARKCDLLAGLFGVRVELLRTEDVSLAGPEAETLREKKRSDLARRAELVNQTAGGVLLSIHQNSYPDASYSGAQVFYRPTAESEAWAVRTQTLLRDCIDPANRRQAKEVPSDLYLMSHIGCTAILVECGFLSHPEEALRLTEDGYQLQLAAVLTAGFLSSTFDL